MVHQDHIEMSLSKNNTSTEVEQEKYLREITHHYRGLEKPLKYGPPVETLTDLIQALHREFSTKYVNIEMVNHLMLAYTSNPKEWQKFAKFDRYKYTRNLVDAGNDKFNLMILCWGEGHQSSIHDHSDSHCFMKMLQGELREIRYAMPSADGNEAEQLKTNTMESYEGLEKIGESIMALNDVAYINDNLGLHRVENTSHSDTAVSLHLYCPPFDSCSIYEKNSGRRIQSPMTFWSKYGQKVIYDK